MALRQGRKNNATNNAPNNASKKLDKSTPSRKELRTQKKKEKKERNNTFYLKKHQGNQKHLQSAKPKPKPDSRSASKNKEQKVKQPQKQQSSVSQPKTKKTSEPKKTSETKKDKDSKLLGKRKRQDRIQSKVDADEDDGFMSDHSNDWKRKNIAEIDNDDNEIKMLERKLGIRTDPKRKNRYFQRIEQEGLGLGIFDFLDDIEKKAKIDKAEYQRPNEEYKFNDPKFEVALGASDIEDGGNEQQAEVSSSDQEGFDEDGNERKIAK